MAPRLCCTLLFLYFTIVSLTILPSLEARKMLGMEKVKDKLKLSTLGDTLVVASLAKGTVPPSAPSQKGHAMIVNQKLLSKHFSAIDRILRSVPSPGVGH